MLFPLHVEKYPIRVPLLLGQMIDTGDVEEMEIFA